jgi:hypothetical protein
MSESKNIKPKISHHVTLKDSGVLTSRRARKSFFTAVETPALPNEVLKSAFERYRNVSADPK